MYKQRLKEYVEQDTVYQEWCDKNLSYVSDFDRFCVEHCQDIKDLLNENECLQGQIDYLRRSCERKEETIVLEQSERAELEGKIDKAIDLIEKSVTSDIGINSKGQIVKYHQLTEDETGELLEILKGSGVDE